MSFNRYLDTILAAHSPPPGSNRQTQSPWLFLDAAHTIFDTAKRRVYTGKVDGNAPAGVLRTLPDSLRPVLEEQPKWALLSEVLEEIERDNYFNSTMLDDSNGTILIACSDQATCRQLREYIQTMHVKPEVSTDEFDLSDGEKNHKPSAVFMMRRKLRDYLNWKRDFAKVSASLFAENQKALSGAVDVGHGANGYRGKGPPNKRRRVRGGSASATTSSRTVNGSISTAADGESHVAGLLADIQPTELEGQEKPEVIADPLHDLDDHFEMLDMNDLVIVHPYDGDMDEHVLEEVKPRHIIMYEPEPAFIRRVEVYRSSHTNRNVRVYFIYYGGSVEEQRYLSAVRREKDAFTRLIKEKAVSSFSFPWHLPINILTFGQNMSVTLTLAGKGVEDPQEQFLRTVNTRIAGGGRLTATAEPPRIVVDVREFRSSLPSLLHGQNIDVVPCMLTVGDYVVTPHICVERKSVRDLISSFKNGRLYNQVETMLQYYKSPMLLIEFDQNKSFTLEVSSSSYYLCVSIQIQQRIFLADQTLSAALRRPNPRPWRQSQRASLRPPIQTRTLNTRLPLAQNHLVVVPLPNRAHLLRAEKVRRRTRSHPSRPDWSPTSFFCFRFYFRLHISYHQSPRDDANLQPNPAGHAPRHPRRHGQGRPRAGLGRQQSLGIGQHGGGGYRKIGRPRSRQADLEVFQSELI